MLSQIDFTLFVLATNIWVNWYCIDDHLDKNRNGEIVEKNTGVERNNNYKNLVISLEGNCPPSTWRSR